jgi:hypothetical protein
LYRADGDHDRREDRAGQREIDDHATVLLDAPNVAFVQDFLHRTEQLIGRDLERLLVWVLESGDRQGESAERRRTDVLSAR